ncbi:MAG: hypothetical protein IB618_04265 [Candidatus Pacearchaeota archaeon]|nr:MAG: hypothetical protein IB618_04265 [Candidatus Pacearchaeota archaeon]
MADKNENLSIITSKIVEAEIGCIIKTKKGDKYRLVGTAPITKIKKDSTFGPRIIEIIAYKKGQKKGKKKLDRDREKEMKNEINKMTETLFGKSYDYNNEIPLDILYEMLDRYKVGALREFDETARKEIYKKIGWYVNSNPNTRMQHCNNENPKDKISFSEIKNNDEVKVSTYLTYEPYYSLEDCLRDMDLSVESIYEVIEKKEKDNDKERERKFEAKKKLYWNKTIKALSNREFPLNLALVLLSYSTSENIRRKAKENLFSYIKDDVVIDGPRSKQDAQQLDFTFTRGNGDHQLVVYWLKYLKEGNLLNSIIGKIAEDKKKYPGEDLERKKKRIYDLYNAREKETLYEVSIRASDVLKQKIMIGMIKEGVDYNFLDSALFSDLFVWKGKNDRRIIMLRPYDESYLSEPVNLDERTRKLSKDLDKLKIETELRNEYYKIFRNVGVGTQIISAEGKDLVEVKNTFFKYIIPSIL